MKKKVFLSLIALCVASIFVAGCATSGTNGSSYVSDSDLYADVTTRLESDNVTGRYPLGVTVRNGVVTLRGSAPPSNAVRARVVSIALGTPGVVEVVDELYPPTDGMY